MDDRFGHRYNLLVSDLPPLFTNNRNSNSRQVGYVFYRPKGPSSRAILRYDPEAYRIVYPTGEKTNRNDFSKYCRQWASWLDRKRTAQNGALPDRFLDIYRSHRRQYAVSGVVMAHAPKPGDGDGGYYLFMVERIVPGGINLPMLARRWKLTTQEQAVVQRLLLGQSNKQMAHEMGLALNTVKCYVKCLSRKMGVRSRAGIVSLLLFGTGAPPDVLTPPE